VLDLFEIVQIVTDVVEALHELSSLLLLCLQPRFSIAGWTKFLPRPLCAFALPAPHPPTRPLLADARNHIRYSEYSHLIQGRKAA